MRLLLDMETKFQVKLWCQLKLVEVVPVANVNNMDRVGNSLLQIWELRSGQNA